MDGVLLTRREYGAKNVTQTMWQGMKYRGEWKQSHRAGSTGGGNPGGFIAVDLSGRRESPHMSPEPRLTGFYKDFPTYKKSA